MLTVEDTEPPAKPAGLAVLTWTDPGDATITGWQYQQDGGTWTDIPGSGPATVRHRIDGLTPGTTYTFRIRAVDTGGVGAPSDGVTVDVLAAAVVVEPIVGGFRVTMTAPRNRFTREPMPVSHYKVKWSGGVGNLNPTACPSTPPPAPRPGEPVESWKIELPLPYQSTLLNMESNPLRPSGGRWTFEDPVQQMDVILLRKGDPTQRVHKWTCYRYPDKENGGYEWRRLGWSGEPERADQVYYLDGDLYEDTTFTVEGFWSQPTIKIGPRRGTAFASRGVVQGVAPIKPEVEPTPKDECVIELSGNATIEARWNNACRSENRPGSYARYYTFTLGQQSEVTIALDSDPDTLLYLLQGFCRKGAEEARNDDHGALVKTAKCANAAGLAKLDSCITKTLPAGNYTIEATTFYSAKTDSFTLKVSGLGGGP